MKTPAERAIESLTWAAVVIWLGLVLVMGLLDYTFLVMVVLGITLLSSAIYQRSQGWHTSVTIWIFGVWMAVFSVVEMVDAIVAAASGSGLGISLGVYLGIALVSMGVAFTIRTLQQPTDQAAIGPTGRFERSEGTQYNQQLKAGWVPPVPTDDNYSSGWTRTDNRADNYAGSSSADWPPSGSRQTNSTRANTPSYEERTQRQDLDAGWGAPASSSRGSRPNLDAGWGDVGGEEQGYGYEQTQVDRQSSNLDSRWEMPQQPQQNYGYQQPQDDYDYQQDYDYWEEEADPNRPADARRRARRAPRRATNTDDVPDDLQSRVDDIIRRSRERRGQATLDDELPY